MEKLEKIHEIVREIIDNKDEKFVPGETPIYTGLAVYDSREINAMIDSMLGGWWALHKKGKEFEENLAKYIGNRNSIYVNSGSSANLLALNAVKIQRELKGGEVITQACTFPTTFNPIIQLGFKPVLVDIDKTLNISPERIYSAINPKTVGIAFTHTLGNPSKIEEIVQIAKDKNLFVLEDCCDALGSLYNGKKCGSFGDTSTFSFYPAHGITTGEGGAISTNSQSLERIIKSLRDWGKDCWCQSDEKNFYGACKNRFNHKLNGVPYDHRYIYSQIGYNLKPLELQAAMGVEQLKRVDGFNDSRKRNFKFYKENLSSIKEIEFPEIAPKADPVFFGLPIIVKEGRRDNLLKFLNDNKIGTRCLFAGNVIYQPAYKNTDYLQFDSLSETDRIMKNCFWIGTHPGLNEEKMNFVVDKFKEYFPERKNV